MAMQEFFFIAIFFIICLIALAWYFHHELSEIKKHSRDSTLIEWLKSMQQDFRGTSTGVAKLLQENTRQVNDRLDHAARVISAVQKNLGEMSEVGKGIKTLQEFLQSPKLRGGIGEQVLKDMIGQTFPKNAFHLQFGFKSGVKVDAVLKTDAGLLCIDSKFPMENFNVMVRGDTETERNQAKKDFIADVKKHISDISKKYILPEEGTMDFALMYIPSEPIYYDVVNTPEIMRLAQSSRVYPVSPSTLYAHLQVLLQSLQGRQLEQKSKQVFQLLRAIQKDYQKVDENISVLNRHVTNAHNQMSNVSMSFGLMGQKLSQSQMIEDSDQQKFLS